MLVHLNGETLTATADEIIAAAKAGTIGPGTPLSEDGATWNRADSYPVLGRVFADQAILEAAAGGLF